MPDTTSFTGRTRERKTDRRVILADHAAKFLITTGGIGTIVAVSLVCAFLVAVVLPLFQGDSVEGGAALPTAPTHGTAEVWRARVDPYRVLAATVLHDGKLRLFRADTGELLDTRPLVEGAAPTTAAFAIEGDEVALGFADGGVRRGEIRFVTEQIEMEDVSAAALELPVGGVLTDVKSVVERIRKRQFRRHSVEAEFDESIATGARTPVVMMDHAVVAGKARFVVMTAEGRVFMAELVERPNLLTGETTKRLRKNEIPFHPPSRLGPPKWLKLSGLGDNVFVGWEDGTLLRFDTRMMSEPQLAETRDLVEEPTATLTVLDFMIGRTSLIAGDSTGRTRVWFRIKPDDAKTPDGAVLTKAKEFAGPPSEVRSLAASSRTRLLAAGYEDGTARLLHVTAEDEIATAVVAEGEPVTAVAITPKEDGLFALTPSRAWMADVDANHPSATLKTLFTPIWYEGYETPEHVWQSSSGTDDFEPKLGLIPLVFGTLKATIYSMLFGAPLALLAALFTSEFLDPRLRGKVKPAVEMMAGLPSVVLGFIAALVIAPYVEHIVPEILTMFVTVPIMVLLGAHLWQLLPSRTWVMLSGAPRFLTVALVAIPAGLWVGWLLAPAVENWIFAGDIKLWLDGQTGGSRGAWMFPLLPATALLAVYLYGRLADNHVRKLTRGLDRFRLGLVHLAKFAVGVLVVLGAAYLFAFGLESVGIDPRGTYVDTYTQRNTMVVGLVMGFAIVPIIYTLAEDALSSVPSRLRAASLGAGATPWQTAVRVVIPTAMSGLFSAVMIGLGRAVGETMIVLMAAGNTPAMEWNLFSGFRTLSANIAVELPEAVRDSTHYRTLFLAALVLFAMTFVLNTVAEIVRQRFRKRAFEL